MRGANKLGCLVLGLLCLAVAVGSLVSGVICLFQEDDWNCLLALVVVPLAMLAAAFVSLLIGSRLHEHDVERRRRGER